MLQGPCFRQIQQFGHRAVEVVRPWSKPAIIELRATRTQGNLSSQRASHEFARFARHFILVDMGIGSVRDQDVHPVCEFVADVGMQIVSGGNG